MGQVAGRRRGSPPQTGRFLLSFDDDRPGTGRQVRLCLDSLLVAEDSGQCLKGPRRDAHAPKRGRCLLIKGGATCNVKPHRLRISQSCAHASVGATMASTSCPHRAYWREADGVREVTEFRPAAQAAEYLA